MSDIDQGKAKGRESSRVSRRQLLQVTGLSALGIGGGCLRLQDPGTPPGDTPTDKEPTPTTEPSTPPVGVDPEPTETPEPPDPVTPAPIGNFPVEGDEVTFGFNVSQSGPFSPEGEDELRGYRLAVLHLNDGGGWVDMWDDLTGNGVLGKTVTSVDGDTATDRNTAIQSLRQMIERDDVIMASGGSSSATAIAQQELAQEEKVIFMCCMTHSNNTTGPNCVRYGFREMYNAYMTGQALAAVMREEFGEDNDFYQLYADYSWGKTMQETMNRFLKSEVNWNELDSVPTPPGTSDYSSFLSNVPAESDVLVLNHYGLDATNSLPQVISQGLDSDMEIVVPLYNRLLGNEASDSIGGVYGTVDWSWQLQDDASQTFTQSFRNEYNKVPSYAARLAYAATLSYSAAVERAGTFYPPEVIAELENWNYSQAGLGETTMRKCDHQAQRDVLVVRGLPPSEQTEDKLFEIVVKTDKERLGYDCNTELAAQCNLGQYQ